MSLAEMDAIDQQVGRYLLEHKVVDRAKIQEAVAFAREKKIGFRRALLQLDLVDLEFLQKFLPKDVGHVSEEEIDTLSKSFAGSVPASDLKEILQKDAEEAAPDATSSPAARPSSVGNQKFTQPASAGGPKKRLGEYLVDDGVISADQLEYALEYAKENEVFLGTALITHRYVDEETLSIYIIRQRNDAQRGRKGKRLRLGDILVQQKKIQEDQLMQALSESKENGLRLGEVLLDKGWVNESDIALALSEQLMFPMVNLRKHPPDPGAAKLVSKKMVLKHQAMPYRREGKLLTVAMVDPLNIMAIDDFKQLTGCEIMIVIAIEGEFHEAVTTIFGGEQEELLEWFQSGESPDDEKSPDTSVDTGDDAPIIKLVNKVVGTAVRRGVSDIHIDPQETEVIIRFRVDGTLRQFMKVPIDFAPQVSARIKVMSSLDIAETRLPQDGKFRRKIGGNVVDFRVSVLPLVSGEKVVLRVLDQGKARVKLKDLGLSPRAYKWFTDDGIFRPNGIVLVTGPTGSGKTSTLYAALMAIQDPKKNIHTVEDPVEFTLPGVTQVQVHPDIGLDFAAVLKSFLRQDPDIILLGEIRDLDTAGIALKAAMTGHLVLSTLHTNDAISSIDRFLSMGIDRFLVGTAVKVVLAQRLVGRLCETCAIDDPDGIAGLKELGYTDDLLNEAGIPGWDQVRVRKPVGCEDCDEQGYVGRTGIFEVIRIDDEVQESLLAGASNRELYDLCRSKGMVTLREAALIRVAQGVCGVDEVHRLTVPEPSDEKREAVENFVEGGEPSLPGPADGGMAPIAEITKVLQGLETMAGRTGPTQSGEVAQKTLAVFKEAWGDGNLEKPTFRVGMERLRHYLESADSYTSPLQKALAATDVDGLIQADLVDAKRILVRKAVLLNEKKIDPAAIVFETQFGGVPAFETDRRLLKLALEHLTVNSIQAMPQGGRIRWVTRKAETGLEIIHADTGAGLSEAALAEARKPWVTNRPYGLGLGLAIVDRILAELGGSLEVRAIPGKGTIFTLRLRG